MNHFRLNLCRVISCVLDCACAPSVMTITPKINLKQNWQLLIIRQLKKSLLYKLLLHLLWLETHTRSCWSRFGIKFDALSSAKSLYSTHHKETLGLMSGKFFNIVGQDPSDSKSNWLHVDIYRFFFDSFGVYSFYNFF